MDIVLRATVMFLVVYGLLRLLGKRELAQISPFELVVLAWSSARRGITDAVVAAVVGSYAYNATMTLGAAAVVTPLHVADASLLHIPMLAMLAALVLVLVLCRGGRLDRADAVVLLGGYILFVAVSAAP